jgi:divalent metal cation (Fe/Co/Zn/Cd) transporter
MAGEHVWQVFMAGYEYNSGGLAMRSAQSPLKGRCRMESQPAVAGTNAAPLFRAAMFWAIAGIVYNLVEGIISVWLGAEEETLALFGFGVDSFIEAVSAVAIAVMVLRIWRSPDHPRSRFESTALMVTGWCFYVLSIGLVAGAGLNIWQGSQPRTTIAGVIISAISIGVMWIMLAAKLRIGRTLHSDAMIADARCTQVCIYMSVVLLAASGLFELTKIGYVDSVGAVAIAWFSYREGKEALDKAAGRETCCDHACH